ncbi:MAG: GAF domain-containing protein [Chloroflexi bacterium]|nr:GAF domain-containing protein [Chloroflexota bacterium]
MNMYPGSLPFTLPLLAISILTMGMAIYAFHRPKQPGSVTFGWLTTSMTVWSIFYAYELLAPTLSTKILAAKLEYIGIASIPVIWFIFALEYTGHANWLTRGRHFALMAFPTLTFGLSLTNEFHHLMYTGTGLDPQGYPTLVILGYGSWFWVHVAFSYSLILAGVMLYLVSYFQTQRLFRQQMSVMVFGSMLPLIVNAVRLFTPIPLHGFDLTPFTFAFSGILLAIGLFRFSLIDLLPIAAPLVIENLPDAVVVIDEHKRLVDLNPAGRLWLKVGNEAIGRNAHEILPLLEPVWQYWDANETHIQLGFGEGDQRRLFDLSITPLRDSKNRMVGRVIIARDVSREQMLLAAERNHASQMELLNEITNTALQMPDLHQALQVLADQLSQLLRADGASITLWNDAEQRVISATAYGEYRETNRDTKLEPGENAMTASVLREGRPLAVEDVYDTPYMNPQLAPDVPIRSLLGLPLIANERKMGAALISFNQRHQFTTEEIALGEQAAGQIALAIYKAQLYETERNHARQMELLNSITRASLDVTTLREMLQTLADQTGELFQSDGTFITLWDELEQKTIPGAAYGELRETYPSMKFDSKETTLTGSVLRAGHPLAVDDVFNTPHMSANIAAKFPSRSLLALPLIAHGQKLGAALISFNQPHHFTEQEIAIGEQAAAQIALALNKTQLLDTVSHRIVQMGLLQEVSRQMTESLDVTEVCQRTVDAMVNVFGYDEAAISLLIENNELELTAIGGTKDMGFSPGFRQKMGQGIMGHVAETLKPYFSNDIIHDPYYYHPSSQGSGSAMGVPMLREGQLAGVVYIQSTPPHAIIPDDLQTLQTLASHLVTAMQKARLYENAHEHLTSMTTLQSVTETVTSSLELGNIFRTVIQLLKETYGYTYVSIYLLNDSTLQLGAQVGYPEELIIREIPVNMGITGRTVRTRQTQFIPNVRADPTFLIASYDVESEICVPLLKNNNILGVLNIESASNRPLTEKDVDLLMSIANPVALAIDNAHLHARATSLALTDGMTGLFNRRAFDQSLEIELARAKRYGHSLSLIIIDMDSFKIYNDTYGHPAGDERLKAIANIMLDNVRDPDVAARYGGEEFAIILPHTSKEGAILLAERLREISERQAPKELIDRAYIPGYTISLGVATFPYDGITVPAILRAADNAEMNAKRLGKNRVCAAESSEKFSSEQA